MSSQRITEEQFVKALTNNNLVYLGKDSIVNFTSGEYIGETYRCREYVKQSVEPAFKFIDTDGMTGYGEGCRCLGFNGIEPVGLDCIRGVVDTEDYFKIEYLMEIKNNGYRYIQIRVLKYADHIDTYKRYFWVSE
jgi:hypothetical protein